MEFKSLRRKKIMIEIHLISMVLETLHILASYSNLNDGFFYYFFVLLADKTEIRPFTSPK